MISFGQTYSIDTMSLEMIGTTSFSNIGGFGVLSPNLSKVKNGLTPGTDYRVMWRTWCNANGGPYRSQNGMGLYYGLSQALLN